jgi:hypothetical protein
MLDGDVVERHGVEIDTHTPRALRTLGLKSLTVAFPNHLISDLKLETTAPLTH